MQRILIAIARPTLVVAFLICPARAAWAAGSQEPLPAPSLLATAERMLQSSGTVHETLVARISVPGTSLETEHVHADFSYQDHWQHIFTRMRLVHHLPGAQQLVTGHSELIGVGTTAAIRGTGEYGQTILWTCLPHTTLDYDPTTFFRGMTQVTDLGPDTIGGMPVWHLRLTASRSDEEQTQASVQLDLAIAQSDDRIVRLTEQTVSTDPVHPEEITVSASLSRYGQPMTAELPAACRTDQP